MSDPLENAVVTPLRTWAHASMQNFSVDDEGILVGLKSYQLLGLRGFSPSVTTIKSLVGHDRRAWNFPNLTERLEYIKKFDPGRVS
jgi:hypothetical protein